MEYKGEYTSEYFDIYADIDQYVAGVATFDIEAGEGDIDAGESETMIRTFDLVSLRIGELVLDRYALEKIAGPKELARLEEAEIDCAYDWLEDQ